jgi:hypothetical protein
MYLCLLVQSDLLKVDEPFEYLTETQSPLSPAAQDMFLLMKRLFNGHHMNLPSHSASVPEVQNSTLLRLLNPDKAGI